MGKVKVTAPHLDHGQYVALAVLLLLDVLGVLWLSSLGAPWLAALVVVLAASALPVVMVRAVEWFDR